MSSSLSFDRAADFYDGTRELPEELAKTAIEAILETTGPRARILDVGTGTGRVSVPLLRRGADLVGCDISTRMMAKLREKFQSARLVEADASWLPFPANHFDAVITCHVMHLVGPWREAIHEYQRVLRPGGVYINVQTERTKGDSVGTHIRDFWKSRLASYGASSRRPGVEDDDELRTGLLEAGATFRQVEVGRYKRSYTVQDIVNGIANRIHSSTWVVPDDVFARTVAELREWADGEFKDQGTTFEEESAFSLEIAQFSKGSPD